MFNIMKGFRGISAAIDLGIYKIIAGAFSVFFNISSSEIINGTIINDIFNRVQLIFGVVVLFRLAISLINGIVSPETVSNAKSGVGNILKRVVVSVLLMSIIVPLNIPDAASGSFEEKLNNNGNMEYYFIPALEQDEYTKLLDGEEKQRVISNMNSWSINAQIDSNGKIEEK